MPLDLTQRNAQFANELDFILHFQNILLRAVEGERDVDIDAEYRELRAALLADPKYEELIPPFVQRNRDLGSLWPELKSFSPQWEPRRVEVRRQFEPAIAEADRIDPFGNMTWDVSKGVYDSSAWTGATRPAARLAAVKTLLPVANAAIERLIQNLEEPNHNGGPPMDATVDAIDALRSLHKMVGEILRAADDGNLEGAYHDGLVSEASRYAKRAAKKLRDDPMPYAMSAMLLAVLSACGFPGLGGFLSSVAANIQRK